MIDRGCILFQTTDKVTVIIYATLILAPLQIQVCGSANLYCPEAVKSVKVVSSCPTSKEKWDKAAIEKNCTNDAAQQNCTSANLFLYHCVINGYGNETLEVCAPRRVIFGFCTEFNVAGGVIQVHASAKCTNKFPKCDAPYLSTDAYNYPYCYDVDIKTQKSTTPSNLELITCSETSCRRISIFVATSCVIVIVFFGFIVFSGVRLKRKIDRLKDQTKENGHLIPIPNQGGGEQTLTQQLPDMNWGGGEQTLTPQLAEVKWEGLRPVKSLTPNRSLAASSRSSGSYYDARSGDPA